MLFYIYLCVLISSALYYMLPDLLLQSVSLLFVLTVLGQSGLDKALHFRGNLDYFRQQFKNTPFSPATGGLLAVITLMETGSAVLAAVGLFSLWTSGERMTGIFAMTLAASTFVCLIFGQRIARDYAGAAGITPYLAVAMLGLYAFS